jgi:hypothetical protein
MTVAAMVIVVATAAVVFGLFVWAARKDGEEDRALQRRLGIRRRTLLVALVRLSGHPLLLELASPRRPASGGLPIGRA